MGGDIATRSAEDGANAIAWAYLSPKVRYNMPVLLHLLCCCSYCSVQMVGGYVALLCVNAKPRSRKMETQHGLLTTGYWILVDWAILVLLRHSSFFCSCLAESVHILTSCSNAAGTGQQRRLLPGQPSAEHR